MSAPEFQAARLARRQIKALRRQLRGRSQGLPGTKARREHDRICNRIHFLTIVGVRLPDGRWIVP